MEIKGSSVIAADKETVWQGLNDPNILQASIPGCESLEAIGENQFKATVATRIGPVKARFSGQVELQDLNPPNGYAIVGSGSAGGMGAAKGTAKVALSEDPEGTRLDYLVDAELSGKIAQLGGRLIQSTAGVLAGQFFGNFSNQISGPDASGAAAMSKEPSGSGLWLYLGIGVALLAILAYVIAN